MQQLRPLPSETPRFRAGPLTVWPLMVAHTIPITASQAQAEVGVLNRCLAPTALSVPHISLAT